MQAGSTPMKINRIRQIALAAPDLEASLTFFRDKLGATLIARFDQAGLAFFDFDGTRLLLEANANPATIYFQVDDIDAAFAALSETGVRFEGEPHMIFRDDAGTFGQAGEGEWMAFFRDPADNLLAIAGRK